MTTSYNENQIIAHEIFDQLNNQLFEGKLPKYQIIFRKLPHPMMRGQAHPELLKIWMLKGFESVDLYNSDFESTLRHEMVHAELYRRKDPNYDKHDESFKELAKKVRAPYYD